MPLPRRAQAKETVLARLAALRLPDQWHGAQPCPAIPRNRRWEGLETSKAPNSVRVWRRMCVWQGCMGKFSTVLRLLTWCAWDELTPTGNHGLGHASADSPSFSTTLGSELPCEADHGGCNSRVTRCGLPSPCLRQSYCCIKSGSRRCAEEALLGPVRSLQE